MRNRRIFIWGVLWLVAGLGTCKQCSSSDNESVLQKDRVYTYRYRSEALAQAVGTTDDHSRIAIDCDVHVRHDRTCSYLLDLQDCMVTAAGGPPGSQTAWIDRQPLPDLSKYPVSFTLENGEIPVVRTHSEDALHHINIKRGVLSAFVFKLSQTQKEIHETRTDVHGTCPLTSIPDETGVIVKTSKDMLRCSFPSRRDWEFSPWSLFWNMSFIQHVINSTTDCVYNIDKSEKKLESVSCKERHAIMLESTHRTTTAVQTNVIYDLRFVKSETQTSKTSSPALNQKRGIQYEFERTPDPQSSPANFLEVAEKMLSDLVLDSADEIRLLTISQFTDFVAWLRSSNNIKPFVDRVRSCSFLPDGVQCEQKIKDLGYSYLSDALLQCNSLPCIKALAYIATKDDVSQAYLESVYRSWSFMHYSKPGFITNYMGLCKMKNSDPCWMSLGSYIQRIYTRDSDIVEEVLLEAREVANFMYSRIGEECDMDEETSKTISGCLVFMKAASNMGRYYLKLVPKGLSQLLEVGTSEHAPVVVRTTTLEALKDVCNPENQEERFKTYDQLLPLLKNETLAPSIRILAYDVLMDMSEDHFFEEHVLSLLKDGKNVEVKYYVANSLNTLMTDLGFRAKRGKFLTTLSDLLRENSLSLEWILYETKGKSKSSSNDMFLNLPFLPDNMKRFGMKIRDSFIYDSFVYPTIFNQKTIFQLFSSYMPATKLGAYFEGFEELILAYQKHLAEMDGKPVSFSKIYEAVLKTLEELSQNTLNQGSLRNFDENILENIRKIHQLYWDHHKKQTPFAKAYLDLFGSTVKHFVLDGVKPTSEKAGFGIFLHSMGQRLADGVSFNTTRVIRVIEAYHQVPTMMGLPLNWTTNATLAFSIRGGLKYQLNREDGHVHAKGFFQPSAALTFLNRMVLDFPTLTQIGVQANSSGYTSTELKAQYNSIKGKQTFRFDRPSRPQKVLELFRTNQLIKHHRYEEISDWDFERVSSSWCTKNDVNAAVGIKLCLSKSYPNVTHRVKPWALMAGWCKWQLLVHPTNENPVHYDVELQQVTKQKLKEYNVKLGITEKDKEKAARFKVVLDENGNDMKLELKTTLMPDFSASLSRSELTSDKKVSGHKIEAHLGLFKDFKYELDYSTEGKVQRSSIKSSSPPDGNSQTVVHEEKLVLNTPYSTYRWNKTVLQMGENIKADASLSYENLKAKSDWLKDILPPSFWENEKKASLKVQLHWKKPIHSSEGTTTRQTEFRVNIPRYTMTLNAAGLESNKRQQMNLNLARIDKNHGELDAFLNLTCDWWSNEDGEPIDKDIGVVNVTIPRRSWSALYQKVREDSKYHHEIRLKRAVMKPKKELTRDYIVWWSEEVGDLFTVEEKEIKLMADNEWSVMSNDEVASKYSTMTREELGDLQTMLVLNNIVLTYPLTASTETIVYDGYLVLSSARTTVRYQKTFNLTSSYNNLRLTSNSVYGDNSKGTELNHSSYFTHLGTLKKAYNTIHYSSVKSGRCYQTAFKHDIRSHVFDLSTDITHKCTNVQDRLYTLRLTLNTNSSRWSMLDMKIDQIIEDVSRGYSREEMMLTHELGTIHVDAEWHSTPRHHQKRVVFCSKNGHCPNAELFLENFHDGKSTVKFSLPNRNDTQITYERKMSSDYKKLDVKIGYFNHVDGLSDMLDLTVEVLTRHYHVWKGTLNANAYAKVKDIFVSGYNSVRETFVQIARDPKHPLNEMLLPALKMTLYDYWHSLKTQMYDLIYATWDEIFEIVYTIESFAEPAYVLTVNAVATANDLCRNAYYSLKEKSVMLWAIDYFHLPYYIHQGFSSLPHSISELLNQIALGEENILHFKFITGKLLAFGSFIEWPFIQLDPSGVLKWFQREAKETTRFRTLEAGQKMAMIFGPHHVYTFDGHLYDAPPYPHEDCLYLLAHDVHSSLFTVLSSEKKLHILFPEMSVTVNDRNEVFINESPQPSSLPIQSSNGKVIVKRDHVLEVWSPSLTVICRSEDFLCFLKLREYHSGGIIGLLGNADEYSTNEYMLPSGNVSTDLAEFSKMYEVSGKAECQNIAIRPKLEVSDELSQSCLDAFGYVCNSHHRIRDQFLKACMSDVKAGHGTCYATSGLSALCHLQHKPSHTKCNAKKQEKETIGRNLEVVFIVQESKHLSSPDMSNAPGKGIESLVRALDEKFRSSGYEEVKYSVVGYGGSGVHAAPTVHSAGKDIWISGDAMIEGVLRTLEFTRRDEADGVRALKYALEELGHDSFNSKVFIMITAKDKQLAEKSLMDYIQEKLDKNGITLYTISSYPSIEKGKKVFGVRADGLIFPAQSKDGDAYLDFPRGNLAKLASSTRGSIFLSKFLRENKPQAFFAELAQEVWAKINKEAEKCRSCKPIRGEWWWYKNQCFIGHC